MSTPKRSALGRGLGSLIAMDDVPARGSSAINDISLDLISPNPDQPRTTFDEEALEELATSIRELGIIQPLSLRKIGPDSYQIIVPAYIRSVNETELTEMALIENIQREDLNAIEVALTFKKLIDQYSLTQERLSERIGKKRATIANFLRLLRLPAEVQLGLRDKRVDMGHARALLSVEDPSQQLKLYNQIIKEGLSVRRVEELAKALRENNDTEQPNAKTSKSQQANEYDVLARHMSQRFAAPVAFTCNKAGKGKITFSFKNEAELERLIAIFDKIKLENV